MKTLFLPFLILALLANSPLVAQDGPTISLTGDTGTEQAAKLELIRILQERLNKLTVAQLNSRIIVSSGVTNYYKVDEILSMHKEMWGLRVKYGQMATRLSGGNASFNSNYNDQLVVTIGKADAVKKQLMTIIKSGRPIQLPALPTFSITPAATAGDIAQSFTQTMQGIMSRFGITSQADIDNLSADQRAAFQAAVDAAKAEFEKAFQASASSTTKSSLTMLGNVVGTLFGVPGAGTIVAGLASGGGAAAIAGLVGSIVDKFQIPTDYYDSETLKLTDSERIKIIDDLHIRISEAYQQTIALGASMSSETKSRYKELSQPRNELILYGPKK